MACLERHRLIQIGNSNVVILPKPWLDYHGYKAKKLGGVRVIA